jgi:hypothetical protein
MSPADKERQLVKFNGNPPADANLIRQVEADVGLHLAAKETVTLYHGTTTSAARNRLVRGVAEGLTPRPLLDEMGLLPQ